jgi:hypothetical protein
LFTILIVYICSAHYLIYMQKNYKSASKESAFIPLGLSDEPLSAEVSLFNNMQTKEIPNYPGYFIVSNGTIISIRQGYPKIMTLYKDGGGRLFCQIYENKQYKNIRPHRLVAEAFIPNPNNYPQINHKNGICTDNRIENLEWCDQFMNAAHAEKHGLMHHARGESSGKRKQTNDSVREIRRLYKTGIYKYSELGLIFKCSGRNIQDIVNRVLWKHIE